MRRSQIVGAVVALLAMVVVVAAVSMREVDAVDNSFTTETVLSGLLLPTNVEFAPDGRIFVAEKSGIVQVFDNLNDATPEVFVDLRTEVHNWMDRGLLGLELHPNWSQTPYVYVAFTHDGPVGSPARRGVTLATRSTIAPTTPTGATPASASRRRRSCGSMPPPTPPPTRP